MPVRLLDGVIRVELSLMSVDRNFDDLADKLDRHIYGSVKGKIRQAILWRDLTAALPGTFERPQNVLDAGGGEGHLSRKLALCGHKVTLCDLSSEMVSRAKAAAERDGVAPQMCFLNCPLQELQLHMERPAELILCHAVLEWTAQPRDTLKSLVNCLAPGGAISLMFYNIYGMLWHNLMVGNLRHVAAGMPKLSQNSLQPDNPLYPEQVEQWLIELGLSLLHKSGVRVLFDYWPKRLQKQLDMETILNLEQKYCREPPFMHLGRYLHIVAFKPAESVATPRVLE